MLDNKKFTLILASASPRRRELIGLLGISDFKVCPADSEVDYPSGMEPCEAVKYIALNKAQHVKNKGISVIGNSPAVILAADTVVCLDGDILGKPSDKDDARRMLRALSGEKHTVYTGIALACGDTLLTDYAATDVWFRGLTDEEIDAYIKSGEPMDKAGAYGAQGLASLFVARIDGEYFNVVGLPLCTLGRMFTRLGFPLI
jgi:septum formation protein